MGQPDICQLSFTLDAPIPAPVYVYYELDNFYQNHRRYMNSRSNKQIMGQTVDNSTAATCDPIILNKDVADPLFSVNGQQLDPYGIAYPCGLIAKSVFTDSYNLTQIVNPGPTQTLVPIPFDSNNIAWKSD